MNRTKTIGFMAIWHNKPSEFNADPAEESEIRRRIQSAFENGVQRGICMYGLYGCRWSSHQKYFSFWQCPSFSVLEDTIDDLEQAGDFIYASSEHMIGVRVAEEGFEEEEDILIDPARYPFGFFAAWRRTASFLKSGIAERKAIQSKIYNAFDYSRERGVQMLGIYDCRWSTGWDYFTYWAAPTFQVLEATIDRLEQAGDFWLSESRHLIGNYEPFFQSGWHTGKKE
jgi:hypothetical protein